MTESLPFTSDELKAARRWRQQANLVLAGVYHFDRLLAAVADANQRAEQAEEALYTFLDALVVAKQNDDVMSVVDAMLETYVQGALVADQPDPDHRRHQ